LQKFSHGITVVGRLLCAGWCSDPRTSNCASKTDIIVDEPSEEAKKQNRLISAATQTMYIVADLAPSSRYRAQLLCHFSALSQVWKSTEKSKNDFSRLLASGLEKVAKRSTFWW